MSLSLPIILIFALALVSPWLVSRARSSFTVVGGLMHLGIVGYYIALLTRVTKGGVRPVEIAGHIFPTNLIEWNFIGTAWGLMFAALVSGIGLLVFLYAVGYFGNAAKGHRFFLWLLAFEASMLGVVLSDHAILMFLFWELTSITSFFLIGFLHKEFTSRWNAQQALLVTGTGGMCLLAGFLLLGQHWGTFSLDAWRGLAVTETAPSMVVLILLLLGAATKSALFPFFFWLPNAMSAPTPVSSYLHSATMVKAGIFLIGAIFPVFATSPEIMQVIVGMGAATAITGLILGWVQTDLKKILAYTTLTVLGLLAFLLGVGTEASIRAAILLLLAHACYKAGLFMAAGAVDKSTGTRDLRILRGLRKRLPYLAGAMLLLGLSAIGIPPFLGFLAKEYGYGVSIPNQGQAILVSAFLLFSNITMMVLILRVALTPFSGEAGDEPLETKPLPKLMMVGPLVLAGLGIVLGLAAPLIISPLTESVIHGIAGESADYQISLWHGFKTPLFLSIATLVGGWFIYQAARSYGKTNALSQTLGLAEKVYDAMVHGLMKGAAWVTGKTQNGDLRTYLHCLFIGLLIVVAYNLSQAGTDLWALFESMQFPMEMETGLIIVMGLAVLMLTKTSSRMTAVLNLAVVGLIMAFLFARLGAPDLALTLIMVEALMVVLFIYVVYGLPKIRNITPPAGRIFDVVLSVTVGGVMALLTFMAQEVQSGPTISTQLTEWSYTLAKGKNVVNVILVDFRALDTLGEIVVVAMAAVGGALLWSTRGSSKTDHTKAKEENL